MTPEIQIILACVVAILLVIGGMGLQRWVQYRAATAPKRLLALANMAITEYQKLEVASAQAIKQSDAQLASDAAAWNALLQRMQAMPIVTAP
jgi:hypothetical protein